MYKIYTLKWNLLSFAFELTIHGNSHFLEILSTKLGFFTWNIYLCDRPAMQCNIYLQEFTNLHKTFAHFYYQTSLFKHLVVRCNESLLDRNRLSRKRPWFFSYVSGTSLAVFMTLPVFKGDDPSNLSHFFFIAMYLWNNLNTCIFIQPIWKGWYGQYRWNPGMGMDGYIMGRTSSSLLYTIWSSFTRTLTATFLAEVGMVFSWCSCRLFVLYRRFWNQILTCIKRHKYYSGFGVNF